MVRDNKDRYGQRHREDDAYNVGESKPGTVGDSEGTFHDRASSDNNVIVDGNARNYEDHKRNQQSGNKSSTPDSTQKSKVDTAQHQKSTAQGGQFTELDGEVIEVEVERVSGSGNPLAFYQGTHVHVPNGEPGESYDVKLDAQSGYFVGQIQLNE